MERTAEKEKKTKSGKETRDYENNRESIRATGREEKALKLFLLLLTIIVAAAIAYNLYERSQYDGKATALNKESIYREQVKEQLQEKADLSGFHFRVSALGRFPDGTRKPGDMFIENPADNQYRMQVIIKEKKTGEELYKSPVLAPGRNVSRFALKKDLPKGTCEAIAYIEAIEGSGENQKRAGRVTSDIRLKVR